MFLCFTVDHCTFLDRNHFYICYCHVHWVDFPGGWAVNNPPANAGDAGFDPWVRKIPWRRKWPPTPVFLPGKSSGQRSLAGYSPRGHKRVGRSLATKQQKQHKENHGWCLFLWIIAHLLEKETATHSSVLAWRIPGMGSHRVGHDWSDLAVSN